MAVKQRGETTIIDESTLEVKGKDSGKVYGKGSSLAEALAIQNQYNVGGTPTISGRPDLYAVEPTAQEKSQSYGKAFTPITDEKTGASITPTVATSEQLTQAAAGTLPSFRASTGATYLDGKTFTDLQGKLTEADLIREGNRISLKPGLTVEAVKARTSPATAPTGLPEAAPAPVAPPQPTTFADAIREATKGGAEKGYESALGAPDSYDNQILRQRAAMLAALHGDAVTPEDLRWLNPQQQAAIRSGKKEALEAQLVGLNSIMTGRKSMRDEEAARKEKEDAKRAAQAETTLNLYSENGMWDKLDAATRASLEVSLGLPTGTIDAMAAKQAATDQYDYKYSAGTGNSLIELVTDKKTGKMVSMRTIGSTGTGGGTTTGGFTIPGGVGTSGVAGEVEPTLTFEEFVKQQEDAKKINYRVVNEDGTFGDFLSSSKEAELQAAYEKTMSETPAAKVENYADQFEAVVINLGSVSSQNQARKYFQGLIDTGNTKQMDTYLNRLALEGLSGKSLTDYNSMGTVFSGAQGALQEIDTFAATNPGVYTTAFESAKPFANASRNQDWVSFTAQVQAAQAGYRNALFGAALTPGESALANQFLVDFSRDDIATVKTKLTSMRKLSDEVQSRLLGEQRGVFTDRSLPSLSTFESPITDFIRD